MQVGTVRGSTETTNAPARATVIDTDAVYTVLYGFVCLLLRGAGSRLQANRQGTTHERPRLRARKQRAGSGRETHQPEHELSGGAAVDIEVLQRKSSFRFLQLCTVARGAAWRSVSNSSFRRDACMCNVSKILRCHVWSSFQPPACAVCTPLAGCGSACGFIAGTVASPHVVCASAAWQCARRRICGG